MKTARSSTWDHKADRDLFLAIISEGQLSSVKWDPISVKMQAKGYNFSGSACRQHFQKLRKEAGSSSPAGSARTTTTKKPTAKGKKRKATEEDDDNDDDEEFSEETPSKRKKEEKVKKEEEYDDEGFASQNTHSFKIEDTDKDGSLKERQVIDLENDDLYDEEEDA